MISPRKGVRYGYGGYPPINVRLKLGGTTRDSSKELARLLRAGVTEPAAYDFLWEARHLLDRQAHRPALVMAVNAAEVAVKHYVSARVPEAAWLAMNVPSPPIPKMCKKYLPELKNWEGNPSALPADVNKALGTAFERRNQVVHVGAQVSAKEAEEALDAATGLLRYLDYHAGHTWVAGQGEKS